MKPASDSSDAVPERRHLRGVRLFVAPHLGAFGTIYAVAPLVGGGFAGSSMPPITTASTDHVPASLPVRAEAAPTARPAAPATLPEWARRSETAALWGQR